MPAAPVRAVVGTLLLGTLLLLGPPASGQTAAARADAAPSDATRWYRLSLGGEDAGWMMERRQQREDAVVSELAMEISLARGATEVTVEMASRFVESAGGEPLEMWSRQRLGQQPVEVTYRFNDDGLLVETAQGGRRVRELRPLPEGDWLTPAEVEALTAAQLAAGAERFTYRTIDPLLGPQPVEVTSERVAERVTVEVGGGERQASHWRQWQSVAPGLVSELFLDGDGQLLESVTPLMGFTLTATLADRRTAQARHRAPELLLPTFVRPNRPLPEPRRLQRAVYRLEVTAGELPQLPEAGAQKVERQGGGAARVTVVSGTAQPAGPVDRDLYLAPSRYLDYRHPAVAALLRQALSDLQTTEESDELARRAETLRRFVHHHLETKDLGTAFASASEVARTRRGDCTEHAVLLAALLRAAGIPSRTVGGLLYVERFAGQRDIFGYHMWTQALLDGRWVDLDAMTAEPFDAAHIALATSPLDDDAGLLSGTATLASLVGRVRVEVLEVGVGPADSPRPGAAGAGEPAGRGAF